MEQARQRLCCAIIREHFGQTAERVFAQLMDSRKTLNALLSNDKNNDKKNAEKLIKKALKSLILHQCVAYYEDANIVYYEADIDFVEMRLHFVHYINATKEFELQSIDLEYAHFLILFLCEHGQCTKQQLFDLFASKIYDILDSNTIKMEESEHQFAANRNFGEWTHRILAMSQNEKKKEEMRRHFIAILNWLHLEQCFVCTTTQLQSSKEPILKKRKLNDESPKFMLCHRSFLHQLRSKLIFDFVLAKYDSTYCQIVDIVIKNSLCILRKNLKQTLNAQWQSLNDREQQQQIYQHSVLDFVQIAPINNRYSIGRQQNNDEAEQYNLPFAMSLNDIFKKMNGNAMPNENELSAYLDVLCDGNNLLNELCDILPILLSDSQMNAFYVNVCGIINVLQLENVKKCVHCRFDLIDTESAKQCNDALRIFSALCSMHKIGDKQLSELCVIKHSTIKQILYRMLAEKYVKMEYIPRSSDRDPKKSHFVWSINWNNLQKKILESMYCAMCNLMTKRQMIRKQIEEIDDEINNNKGLKKKKLCAAFEHLTMSIHKIDLQIALHRDF